MTALPSVLQVISTGARVGVSGVTSLLARRLKEKNFRVAVMCVQDGPLVAELGGLGIPAEYFPVPQRFDAAAVLRLARRLKQQPFDIVHSHGQRAMVVANLASRLAGTRSVVTSFHELTWVKATTSPLQYRIYNAVETLIARAFTDACVATSHSVWEDTVRVRRVPPGKLTEIHNAIDREKFHRLEDRDRATRFREAIGVRPGDFLIGTLGSLVPIKGHEHLIAALPHVRAQVPSARVAIAGFGPLRERLARQAAELGVGEHVLFLGDVAEPNLLYNGLDTFALPSLAESCPLVVLEAVACGVPVVASAVGGVPELVANLETGLLVPAANPEALAAAIVRLAREPELARTLTAGAAAHVDASFSADRFADLHAKLYCRLAARGR